MEDDGINVGPNTATDIAIQQVNKQLSAHSPQLSQQVSDTQQCNHMYSTTNLLTLIGLKLLTYIL